jgi:SAM-dependent methyltransferase
LNAEEGTMAIACPTDLDTGKLREEIRLIYARVAEDPTGDFHFHRGPGYAADFLGYDREALAALPAATTAAFAGVGNPLRLGALGDGLVVADIGCGTGMDLLLAARGVGPTGHAIGVDMTEAMAVRARAGARTAGLENVEVRLGDATALPLEDASVDVVISNGALNLTPDKSAAYGEVFRVLRPGGRFFYADIVVDRELSEAVRRDIDLWTG